ncbi:MAG: leucine-rich repeat domain-containing protein [Bacteroidales bacterium]|nr:leucine-rich repeat domain-containing protein [Bacteroidales bacterium]
MGVTYPCFGGHNNDYSYYYGYSKPSEHLVIPDSVLYNNIWYHVNYITDYAFQNCSGLTSVTIPNSVTSIGSSAFSGCTGLTSVTIGNSVTSIGEYAFGGCTGLTSVTIPNSVTSIGNYAFYGCTGLTSVTIPNSVTSIGDYAFYNCANLTSIVIPESVTSIGSSAFHGCTDLTSVTIPNSVTSIGDYAFYGCTSLTSITIPNSVTSIGKDAFFGCANLTSIVIPDSVTSIGDYAFKNCFELSSVSIGVSVTTLGQDVFKNCNNIDVLNWNAKNCTSYNDAFGDKSSITTVNIGDSVEKIPAYFVYNCVGLMFVDIGYNVTNIGGSAFSACNNIRVLNWNVKNCITYNDAFKYKTNLNVVYIGDSVEVLPNYFVYGCTKLTSIALPNNITTIGNSSFENCTRLKTPILPDSLVYIGNKAFNKCRMIDNSLTIPKKVNYIGNLAFDSCSLLNSIIMKGNPPSIYTNTFNDINNNIPLFVPCGMVDDYYAIYLWSNFTNITESQPYEIDINSADTTMGDINIIIEPTCSDSMMLIVALSNNGYLFSHWSDGSTENPKEFSVFSDTALTAYFDPITPVISVASSDSLKGNITGSGEYVYMQTITISANANPYYHFLSWNDGNTENPRTIIVTQDSSFTAIFVSDTCHASLNSNNEEMGNVYGEGIYFYQNNITISAAPNEHYHFVAWNDGVTQNPRNITIVQDTSFTAIFEIDTHNVVVNTNDETLGEVAGGGIFDYGSSVSLQATAVTGYHFSQWNDGNTDNPRTIVITQDTSFVAIFEIDTFFVSVVANDETMGTTPGSGIYDWNTEISVSATAEEHYHFVSWLDGNTSNPRIVIIDKDTTFVAMFEEDDKYSLQVVSSNNTMGTVEGSGIYYAGENVRIKAIANEHYNFSQWSDGSTDNPRWITVISDNTFVANFAKDTYLVSVESENLAMGTVGGSGEYEYGENIFISATSSEGYKFLQWNDGNTDNPRQIRVENDSTFIANFTVDDGVGLQDKEKDDISISLYPNPTSENSLLSVKGLNEDATVVLTDVQGKVIASSKLMKGHQTMEIESARLASGIYYVRVQTANSVRTEKLIKE